MTGDEEFAAVVSAIVGRCMAQNGRLGAEVPVAQVARGLLALIAERGLPRPLAADERGEPGGMPEEECSRLVAGVLAGVSDALLAEAVRQLIKACFHPEFKTCRDSYCAVSPDGSCRRQELARARGRISGSHCVDCPHWVALEGSAHAALLARHWQREPEVFRRHADIFLPEDFRVLRRWLYRRARSG